MSDALRPGEIDLETDAGAGAGDTGDAAAGAADAGAADAGAGGDAGGDAGADGAGAGDGDQEDAGAAGPAAGDPPKKHTGAVAELIQSRKTIKQLTDRLQQIESNPVLQRLTPEVQQAIAEGRLQITPPQSTREAEQERLTSVAEELGLVKGDGTPDLDAAKRVDKFVRSTVQQAVEPMRQGALGDKAQANVDRAVAFATDNGYDVDTVREVFAEIAHQPNGNELLAQSKVCEAMWERAVGRMHTRGKTVGKKGAVKDRPPAAVITEGAGPRGGTVVSQLSPVLQRVYKDQGIDPSKSFTAKNKIDLSGPIDLE